MFIKSDDLHTHTTHQENRGLSWRNAFIGLVLVLVIGSASQAVPAQAAPARDADIEFRFITIKTNPICVGEKKEIDAYLHRRLHPSDPAYRTGLGGSWQAVPGISIKAAVADGFIGQIFPAQNTTDWVGAAKFVFLADNPGETIITFEGTVVTPGWFGTNVGGNTQSGIINHPIKVINCTFKVTTIGDWNGPLGYSTTAVSDEAVVTAGADGQFTGSASVNWVGFGKTFGCGYPLQIASGQANYSGHMDESSQLVLNQTFEPVEGSYSFDCGNGSGYGHGLFTPEPLVISMPASGGVSTLPNILTFEHHGPIAGSVTIVVIPVEDEAAAFNVDTQTALPPWIFLASIGLVLTPAIKRRTGATQILASRFTMLLIIFMLLLVASACQTGPDGPAADSQVTDGAPVNSQDLNGLTVQADVVFGPGAFVFPDTKAGLADLYSYKATLTLFFDGTRDGQAEQWTETHVLDSAQEPAARQLTIEKSGDVSDPEAVFMAELDGAAYERRGESACNATVIDPENLPIERLNPAGFLNGVIGAEAAGSEIVNEMVASHYTFDERAFGQEGLAQSTGELWVASEGGYIVRYLLTTEGDAAYFGEGVEGTLTWDYQLTDVNVPAFIELPADCPAGMVDAPLLPDATNVLDMPSVLAYETSSSQADAAAFYQEEIPGLGWTLVGEPNITDTMATLDFTKGDQALTVIISTGESATSVRILITGTQE